MRSPDNSSFVGRNSKIFLIGFMGSGKSYWGRRWAYHYHLPFIDLDEVIEAKEGKTIAELFEQKGESYFRESEAACLRELSAKGPFIMACGGGAACFHNNLDWMNEQGITVYLSASPETIHHRLIGEKEKRPLLKNTDPASLFSFIKEKLGERESFYKRSKKILQEGTLTDESLSPFLTDQS